MLDYLTEIKRLVVEGEDELVEPLVKAALAAGVSANAIVEEAILQAIEEVGHLWTDGSYFIPDVILSAEAFQQVMKVIGMNLNGLPGATAGKVVIGTVSGDLHDLGKNIVVAMLEGGGFRVIDLGVDVETSTFIEKCRVIQPDILALGAYMSTTMARIKEIIQELKVAGLSRVKVLIGGAPVTRAFADEVGADGYGQDAIAAVREARHLMGVK